MEKRQHRQKEVLMTEGPIWRCLLLFALPLMAGNLFQQLYNTVDSIVVGNFVGKEALAAVGSTDSVINTFIGFFSGMSTGAGVIISQYYGGKKEEKVSVAVQTTIALTLCMSILCTVLALLLVPSQFLSAADTVALLPVPRTGRFEKNPAALFYKIRPYTTVACPRRPAFLYTIAALPAQTPRRSGAARRPLHDPVKAAWFRSVFPDLSSVCGKADTPCCPRDAPVQICVREQIPSLLSFRCRFFPPARSAPAFPACLKARRVPAFSSVLSRKECAFSKNWERKF